jgi:hypothetical protein
MKKIDFEISEVVSTHILYSGKRVREPTVIIRVGSVSLSRKAFILGAALVCCQFLDGLLTYVGLAMLGIHMEANAFLRELMHAYGKAPVLFAVKLVAATFAGILMFYAHRRRWFRWVIGGLICIYLVLAVFPWSVIIFDSLRNP